MRCGRHHAVRDFRQSPRAADRSRDRPHVRRRLAAPHRADRQLRHRLRVLLYLLAYKPILRMLEARRAADRAAAWPTPRRSRRSWRGSRPSASTVLAKADVEGKQLIEEARAAAARVQAEETRKATAAAEQILARAQRGRRARSRAHARRAQTRGRPAGRPDDGDGDRQGPDRRRSPAAGRRDGPAGSRLHGEGSTMKVDQADQASGAAAVPAVPRRRRARRGPRARRSRGGSPRRGAAARCRMLSRLPAAGAARSRPAHRRRRERRAAGRRRCARRIQAGLARVYGPGSRRRSATNPALIGGMRIKVGSDVYDGSVRGQAGGARSAALTLQVR